MAVVATVALGCVESSPFRCELDAQCRDGDAQGLCQSSGYCSFPDPSCGSGQRYGGLAGDDQADQCVAPSNGTASDAPIEPPPPAEPPSTCFVHLRSGANHSCGVRVDGAVFCWGDNSSGQLSASDPHSFGPVRVAIGPAVAVATGEHHSCAVLASGEVWCWGRNQRGQLGDGTKFTRAEPEPVQGLDNAIAIELGEFHSCAVTTTREVLCWGLNSRGQLGGGNDLDRTVPAPVWGDDLAIGVLGSSGTGNHTCAVAIDGPSDGPVLCWGSGEAGQLGRGGQPVPGERLPDARQPISIPGFFGASAVATGGYHTCSLFPGGAIRCAGRNQSGQLGDGTVVDRTTPVPIALPPAASVSAGELHTCATTEAGLVFCWGDNTFGQLGRAVSAPVPRPGAAIEGLRDIAALATGGAHTCARSFEGSIACWGDSSFGQLGSGVAEPPAPSPRWLDLPCQ